MDKTVVISLNGHAGQYRLEGDAYDRLAHYFDRAAARLPDDSDRAEVVGDLERSIGDRLDTLLASGDRAITADDIEGILDEIGAVDTGSEPGAEEPARPRRGRRLQRVHEGKQIAGVCTGLAAYADIDLGWVRTLFVLATVVTAGGFALVYVVLAFVLPVSQSGDAGERIRPRRLQRIQAGKQITGVCNGLAEYSELDVAWVRTLFLFAAVLTAGLFVLVYIAMAFMLPVAATREA